MVGHIHVLKHSTNDTDFKHIWDSGFNSVGSSVVFSFFFGISAIHSKMKV